MYFCADALLPLPFFGFVLRGAPWLGFCPTSHVMHMPERPTTSSQARMVRTTYVGDAVTLARGEVWAHFVRFQMPPAPFALANVYVKLVSATCRAPKSTSTT